MSDLVLYIGNTWETCLCGACVHILSENAYKVTEHGRRTKIVCSRCGKKRFGTTCTISHLADVDYRPYDNTDDKP